MEINIHIKCSTKSQHVDIFFSIKKKYNKNLKFKSALTKVTADGQLITEERTLATILTSCVLQIG